jgi:chromatin segregation and condensation protein Rec8/ScpA/Scc1 (kleisin family)
VNLTEVFESYRSRKSLIVAFLAILEMVHLRAIKLLQRQTFGEILARRQENFETAMRQMDQSMGMTAVSAKG